MVVDKKEEKKEAEKPKSVQNDVIRQLNKSDKGYILIITDNTSGLAKDFDPKSEISMTSNLVSPLVAHNIQIVLQQLRQSGA